MTDGYPGEFENSGFGILERQVEVGHSRQAMLDFANEFFVNPNVENALRLNQMSGDWIAKIHDLFEYLRCTQATDITDGELVEIIGQQFLEDDEIVNNHFAHITGDENSFPTVKSQIENGELSIEDAYLGLTGIVEDDDGGDLISRALDRISHFHGISIGEFMRQAIARQQSCPDVPHLNSKPNLRHSAVKTLVDIGKIAFGVFVGIKLSNAELRRRSH